MDIVERIRNECEKYNLTIASVERNLNISNGTIGKWNKRTPSSDSLYKVAQLLNCSMEYLLNGKEEPSVLSPEQKEWLDLYNQLSSEDPDIKAECVGFIKGYITRGKIKI